MINMTNLHINEIELYAEPRKKVFENYKIPEHEPEMTEFDSGFLCGLIKKYRPQSVLEVGVAGGATTAIILQCLELLSLEYKMYSIDLFERFYQDNSLRTGWIADQLIEHLNISEKHKFLFGEVACSYMNELGDIDMLILDAAHIVPGEILDIITLLPYLKMGSVLVLHDIALNLHTDAVRGMATGIVFSSMCGEKYLNYDDERKADYPNIGAIVINEYTLKNVENIFLSLFASWKYYPSDKDMKNYRQCINNKYSKELVDLFEKAALLQKRKISFKQRFKEAGASIIKGV